MNKREILPKNNKLKGINKALRNNATAEEGILWHTFLKKITPRFHRQRNIGDYIVDFYCPNLRIVIEIDGSQHYTPEAIEYDKQRTEYLKNLGFIVLRFDNYDVKHRIIETCDTIYELCCERAEELGEQKPIVKE